MNSVPLLIQRIDLGNNDRELSHMRQTLQRLIRLTAGYSLVTLLGPLFTVVLTPIYTRFLSPSDYGSLEVAIACSSFVTSFVVFGVDQALNAYFFDGDATYQRNLVTTAWIYVGAAGVIAAIGLVLLAPWLADWLYNDLGRRYVFYLLAINAITYPVYMIIVAGLRLQMNVKLVNLLGLFFLILTALTNLFFVVVLQLKATGIVAAIVFVNASMCSLALIIARKSLLGRLSLHLLKPLARTGAGLLLGSMSFLLLAGVDRLLLTQYVSQDELGLYAIANKLASMLYILLSSAWQAWYPLALEMGELPDAPRQFARMFEYFAAASMFLALSIGFFAPEILLFFTRAAYVPAAPYALVLLIYSGPLAFMSSCLSLGFYVRKRTHFITILYSIAAVVNVVLNLVLNPVYGVWGAVWATVVAGGVLLVLAYILGQRVMYVPYRLIRVCLLGFICLGMVAAILLVPAFNTLLFKLGTILVFLLATISVGIVSYTQLTQGIQIVRQRLVQAIR